MATLIRADEPRLLPAQAPGECDQKAASAELPGLRQALSAEPLVNALRAGEILLLADQSRRFTGSTTWLSPWVAVPLTLVLLALQAFCQAQMKRRSGRLGLGTWLVAMLAGVALLWPLNQWSVGVLAGAAALALVAAKASPALAPANGRAVRLLTVSPKLSLLRVGLLLW